MVCPACGLENPDTQAVCETCGAVLVARTAEDRTTRWPAKTGLSTDTDLPTSFSADSPTVGVEPGLAAESFLVPGQMFGTRYKIARLLGQGGMGAVYQADDLDLGVPVALKVIRPEITANPRTAGEIETRFKRELLLSRQVTHRNVVRIYDLGEIKHTKYISMSFIDGENLATVLLREGRLPVSRALRIARSIAAGLSAAHAVDIVHRDLKPGNVMIDTEGEALIMDFGIARSTGTGTESTDRSTTAVVPTVMDRTVLGTIVGTVPYMAPEQASGRSVDQRADVYAFGLILYDMLTQARRAELAKDPQGEVMGRMRAAPPPVGSIEQDVPAALDAIITRCLQPKAEDRFENAAAVLTELGTLDDEGRPLPIDRTVTRRQMMAAAAAVIALLTGTWWLARPEPMPPPPEPRSVLITDFVNQTGDAVFEGAVEQALRIALEEAPYLTVYRTNDARALAKELAPNQGDRVTEEVGQLIARREGIAILMAGSIGLEDGEYRLVLQAKDPATGGAITAVERRVGDKAQVLNTVAAMTTDVREALGESEVEPLPETVTAGSIEAMRAYVRGQELAVANRSKEALQQYELAVQLDPQLGRAYAGMAVIHANIYKDLDKAEQYYKEANRYLDRMTKREQYRTLGTYHQQVSRNYEQAIATYEQLVQQYPADDAGHGNLALAYLLVGNVPRALAEVQQALKIYPRNSLQRYNYAMYSMYAGDFATAIAEGARLEKENPEFEYNLIPLSISQLASGDDAAAAETYTRLSGISPLGAAFATLGRADAAMYRGRYTDAIQILMDGIAADTKENLTSELAPKYIALAEAYAAAGQRSRAANAALQAAKLSRHESTLFPAARVLLHNGRESDAEMIALDLENMLQRHTTAYAGLIRGEIASVRKRPAAMVETYREAQKRQNSWFSRFLLGKAYVETGHYAEAFAELDDAIKRRGETTDVFFSDRPTLRYLPPAYYWLARAQQELGSLDGARANYEQYLTLRGSSSPADPLAVDARARLERIKR